VYPELSCSNRKLLGLKDRFGKLGLLALPENELRGGSSMLGEVANRGEMENAEELSETRDGAPSTDSALEPSDAAGEGSGPSKPCCDE
jgi:hypothetical protein